MTGDLEQSAQDLEDMIRLGHVNIYMFIGGTNFGFMNGSNYYKELSPDVTSYDYDAVLTEAGDLTEKYYRYQEIIRRVTSEAARENLRRPSQVPAEYALPAPVPKKAYGRVQVKRKAGLMQSLSGLSVPVESLQPKSMERLGQSYGYILYTSPVRNERKLEKLRLWEASDRANVFLGDERLLDLYDHELEKEHELDKETKEGEEIRILVENMGRVNFGPRMNRQRKGIDNCVQINGHMHTGWKQYTLPLDNIEQLDFEAGYTPGMPAFYEFDLTVDEPADTFLELAGWGKGCVFLNGFNLGRFWEIGPQKRLYVPAPLLKRGHNQIIVFETEGKTTEEICFYDEPDVG